MSSLVASVTPGYVETVGGQSVRLTLSVANTADVIDAYSLRVYGLDAAWVLATPDRLSLFPGDIGQVTLDLAVPHDFPAGIRQISVHVQSENNPSDFALGTCSLFVADRPLVSLQLDPVTITGGKTAQFAMVVVNQGNAAVDVVPDAIDPEELAEFRFEPEVMHLLPGEQQVVQANVTSKRPWVGAPKVRVLTFRATAVGRAETIGTFLQRPRISRWLLSLIGLMAAAAVFAAVISRTLNSVVDEAAVSADVVNEALNNGSGGGQTVSLQPATVKGSVVSSTTNEGIAGVQAMLYNSGDGTVPIASAATSDDGSYGFGRLSEGTYRLRFTGAGFSDLWYSSGRVFAEAIDVEVSKGEVKELPPMVFGGRPGTVSGRVIAPDVTGTKITLVRPGLSDPNVPAVVGSIDVAADGSFVLSSVPSPATYELRAERPGSAQETRQIELGAGATVENIEIVLRPGDGVISGSITADNTAKGGVTVEATDGTNRVSTVSLTEAPIGTYVLRNLATPGVYTVTVTRVGYQPQTRTLSLAANGTATADWALQPATGTITGTVFDGSGQPLGGVAVTLTGGSVSLATRSITQPSSSGLAPGSYRFEQMPVPGTYTLTFSADGAVDQVRLVEVGGNSPVDVPGIDVVMSSSQGMVSGTVVNVSSQLVATSTVTLTNGASTRTLATAHDPLGHFSFSAVDPGTYTLTASLQGASPVVQLVTVQPGQALSVDLQLGQQASLSGRVVDTTQLMPIAGVQVRLYLPAQFPAGIPIATATTLADGTYAFLEVAAPADFIVAVYVDPASVAVLDNELVLTVPGQNIVVGDLIGG
ncbi:MAG TPA: carboxypeptidase regulatory-like domain-containing protein [Ilumatobacteraceae bacterium]|nr:carboxypeptidase regulatory-like domain-containing protein [Ilumatobacteraceae bacterium]HRB02038.1 carboxypeptidase regulatory-like domain-containing protein [Ilumatobacteraceae bacterium]